MAKEKGQTTNGNGQIRIRAYSNVMMVCIQKNEKGEPSGEIIHLNLLDSVSFQGMKELEFRIEEIARFLNLPESSKNNLFKREDSGNGKEEAPENSFQHHFLRTDRKEDAYISQKEFWQILPTEQWKKKDLISRFPEKKVREVICLELLGRWHRSLQGRIRCRCTKGQYMYFRSGLELMHFLAEILQKLDRGIP